MSLNTLIINGLITIIAGLIACFYGYRMYRIVLAIAGFFIGFAIGAALAAAQPELILILIGIVAGLIGAVLMWYLYVLGVIVAGGLLGAAVALTLITVLNIENSGLALVIGLVGLIGGGLVAFWLKEPIIIVSTAFSGAASMVYGLALLLPDLFGIVRSSRPPNTPLALILLIVLAVLGALFQFRDFYAHKPPEI
jgi:uncharacterized protein DUF4203